MNVILDFWDYETMPMYIEELRQYKNKMITCDELWDISNNNKYLNVFKKPVKPIYIGKTTPSELKQIKWIGILKNNCEQST